MKKILVVDNDELILEFMNDILTKEGHEVITAKDGLSALDILKDYTPDVIFIDLIMPNIGGEKLCEIIRGTEELNDAFLIVLSALAAEEEIDIAQMGADACIAKGAFDEMTQDILATLDHIDLTPSQHISTGPVGTRNGRPRGITKELLSVKRHFEIILESMSEGILEITAEGTIVYANSTAVSLINIPDQKLLASNLADIFDGDDRRRVKELLNSMSGESKAITDESPVNLNRHQVTLNILPMDGDGSSAVAIVNDVTERKRSEKALRKAYDELEERVKERTLELENMNNDLKLEIEERQRAENALRDSEERYKALFERSLDCVYIHDFSGQFIDANPSALNLLGYKLEDMPSLNFASLLSEDQLPIALQAVEEIAKNGFQKDFTEFKLKRKDSEYVYIETNGCLLYRSGKPYGIMGIARDITDRKRAEEELRKHHDHLEEQVSESAVEIIMANEQLKKEIVERKHAEEEIRAGREYAQNIIDSSFDMIIATDNHRSIVEFNRAAEEVFGYRKDEALGKCVDIVYADPEEGSTVNKTAHETGLFAGEITNIRKDGTSFPAFLSATVLRNGRGEVVGTMGISRDIEEKKKLQEYLQQAQKMEAIADLAGGIAHDFNNLLTPILANIEMSRMDAHLGRTIYDNLSDAKMACMQARGLAQRFFTFSKSSAPMKKTGSLVECIKGTTILALSGSNVNCEFSVPEDLWLVDFDEGQMNQVFLNLAVNAKEAMAEGGTLKIDAENVSIKARKANSGFPLKDGKYIKIFIKDEGIGIPKEDLPRIFDAYFSTKQRGAQKGMGLGLTTVHSIITKHDGYIQIDSDKGVGTTFCIYVPASEKDAIAKKSEEEKPVVGTGRILVMDDDEMIRNLAGRLLSLLGYEVALSKNDAEAAELYKESMKSGEAFDAVILDLTVRGGEGGKKTIQELLEIDPGVRGIVTSGYIDHPVMTDCKKYGFSGALAKPYDLKRLSQVLDEVIKREKEQG